jgi:hypothetical protein
MSERKDVNWLKTTDLVPGSSFLRALRFVNKAPILADEFDPNLCKLIFGFPSELSG